MTIQVLWQPREVLGGRTFRLPVRSDRPVQLAPGLFRLLQTGPVREGVTCFYLAAPTSSGLHRITVRCGAEEAGADVTVRTLPELRAVHRSGLNLFPRRWPLGQDYARTKKGQTFVTAPDFEPTVLGADAWERARWILAASDAEAWNWLPPAEIPRGSTVNKREGCPQHGTALFAHGGFYPWRTRHEPSDFQCHCPVGEERYPSNQILSGDFTSGPYPDDGFGYIDAQGNRFFFAAYYYWFQMGAFSHAIALLTGLLQQRAVSEPDRIRLARRLGLLLARQAAEELYVAAVPQFRFGSHVVALETPLWGPPDTAAIDPFPNDRPYANGTIHYCVSMPGIASQMALAYDTLFPFLATDTALVDQIQACGVPVARPADVLQLIEESLAAFLQHHLDGYSGCNHPITSVGTLLCLRVLDRPDMGPLLDFLYDTCDDQIRTFVTNGFYPDGVCYEASGGYSAGHVHGAFELDRHIEALRRQQPGVVCTNRFPPLSNDPKFSRVTLPYAATVLCDRTVAAYGDDRAPGVMSEGSPHTPVLTQPCVTWTGWCSAVDFFRNAFRRMPTLAHARVLHRLGVADREPQAVALLREHGAAWPQDGLLLDQGGIGILRLRGPDRDRAAVFLHFISQPFHRHDDCFDMQFVAFDRTWYFDFGYPATHETCHYWEGDWVAHNRGKILDGEDQDVVATGLCTLFLDTPGASAIEAEGTEGSFHDWRLWRPQPKYHRRLVVLVPTLGDGLAVVDLYRLHGGQEHWRTYPGLQGAITWHGPALQARDGTAAGADVSRGAIEQARPGAVGLAMIDDIREGAAQGPWKATWTSRDDAAWRLDLHGLACPSQTTVLLGRGCHPLTKPEESPYQYAPLLLKAPATLDHPSHFDLVFEPYRTTPTLQSARRLRCLTPAALAAAGVELTLTDGTRVVVLWNPDRLGPVEWEAGWRCDGPLAIWRCSADGRPTACLTTAGGVSTYGTHRAAAPAAACGRIVACPDEMTVVVDPVPGPLFVAGQSIRILPRGHWYRIESAATDGNVQRLRLDRTRVLSAVRVQGLAEKEVVLDARLPLAWAGFFRDCTLVGRSGWRLPVLDVRMREDRALAFAIIGAGACATARAAVRPNEWADFVDYEPGDQVAVMAQAEIYPE